MRYPVVLHRGPITAREVIKATSEAHEASLVGLGWSRTPATWADVIDEPMPHNEASDGLAVDPDIDAPPIAVAGPSGPPKRKLKK